MANEKRLIDANALIAEYDRVHIGPPGGARKLIEDAPCVTDNNVGHKWIPVTERLPEQSGKYIVCSERKIKVGNWERMEKKVYQAKYYVYPTGCHWGQRDKGKHITHWMELPEPPKGD